MKIFLWSSLMLATIVGFGLVILQKNKNNIPLDKIEDHDFSE